MARWVNLDDCVEISAGEMRFYPVELLGDVYEEVAPVVHAHWIEDYGDYKCSHCSTEFWDEMVFIVRTSEHEFPNYCPVCGAKMDEEVK